MSAFDIVFLADFRFTGGTSTAIATEMLACARAGYRVALMSFKAPVLRLPHPFHPDIRAAIDRGDAELVDPRMPISCGLLLIHHPQVLTHLPSEPVRIAAENRLLIVHHPPFNGDGQQAYDVARIAANAEIVAGGPVAWAPVGPLVRAQFEVLAEPPWLHPTDWYNIIDPETWVRTRAIPARDRIVIGRHSRPDPLKWPGSRDEVLQVYPDDPDFLVRVLGAGVFLQQLMAPAIPANWEVRPFRLGAAPRFLEQIDFFVYYHHPRWIEAFGRTIIEAMASGCPVILAPHFRPVFGEAAVYASASQARATVRALWEDLTRWRQVGEAGQTLVRERFAPQRHVERVAELVGPPRRSAPLPATPRRKRTILFVTSNGIGLGHLTRAMAIARRLDRRLQAAFLTLSQAMHVVREQGFPVQFVPYHVYLGADHRRWNHFLRLEISEVLACFRPGIVVFDGNFPYGGLISALDEHPALWRVWVRRGMWRPGTGEDALAREFAFDAVIEPQDLAATVDAGPTSEHSALARAVPPITFATEAERLPAHLARAALGLPATGLMCLVQLGSGNNFDFRSVRARLVAIARERPDAQFVVAQSPIADATADMPVPPPLRGLRHYPLGPLLSAFDIAVSAVGYNSFHELLSAGIPTVFVPNENPMMDDQLARARWAERAGYALCARSVDLYGLRDAVLTLLDPEERAVRRRLLERLHIEDGGNSAAQIIHEMAFTVRADRR